MNDQILNVETSYTGWMIKFWMWKHVIEDDLSSFECRQQKLKEDSWSKVKKKYGLSSFECDIYIKETYLECR